jgi:hypothetical protein
LNRVKDTEFQLDPDLRAEASQIINALAFWNSRKGSRVAPSRDQFGLRETIAFAPWLQILDIYDQGRRYRQRLTGTAIVAQLKEDPTQRTYDASSDDLVVQRMATALCWVVANRKPLRTVAHPTAVPQQDFVRHETLFLPLSSDGETIDQMAVVSAFRPMAKSA